MFAFLGMMDMKKVGLGLLAAFVLILSTWFGQKALVKHEEKIELKSMTTERDEALEANKTMTHQISSLIIEKNQSERAYTRKIAVLTAQGQAVLDGKGEAVFNEETGDDKASEELSKQLEEDQTTINRLQQTIVSKDADIVSLQTKIATPTHKMARLGLSWDQALENILNTAGGRVYGGGGINLLIGPLQVTPNIKFGTPIDDHAFDPNFMRMALGVDCDF